MEPLRKREGDVWDRRQESRINIGEPVQIKRQDRGWMYVRSDATEGYAKEEGIFVCKRNHYERYCKLLQKKYQVVIKPGRYRDGQYFRVGTVLPAFEGIENVENVGMLGTIKPEGERMPAGGPVLIRQFLPFTERQLRMQMERMSDIPYSWGDERVDGMDCSSTVRGFFSCFGLALPRNSEEQRCYGESLCAMGQGQYEDLTTLSTERKSECIAKLGIGTVLHMPGHVMIYAGEEKGEPRIFHNCDTYLEDGEEHIVRKTVISRFYPKGDGTYLDYITAAWKPNL